MRTPRLTSWGLLALVAGASTACTSARDAANPAPSDPVFVVDPIAIESVELVRGLGTASGLGVHVKGVVGDGCSELLPVRQVREGNTVTITVERRRPENAICIQIARLFDDVIPLEGVFPPGTYEVRVNADKIAFSIP
jgi:hypothetical protein